MINNCFNVKVYHYADKDQVRIYRRGILCNDNVCVDNDGVIYEKKRALSQELNPFTNEYEHMTDMDDQSRSHIVSMNRTINKVYEIARSNQWEYFFTMTFDGKKVNRYDYSECVKKMTHWLNDMRKLYSPDMKYLVVPERHKDGAYHFHGLFYDIGRLPMVDSGIKHNRRKIYNLPTFKHGFTTVSRVGDSGKASNYVCKYITKELCQVTSGKKRYWSSRNINRPVIETLTVEGSLIDKLEKFSGHIDYMKSVDGLYQGVTYLELDCRLNDLLYFREEESNE